VNTPKGDHVLDSKCQLAIPAIMVDGNPWAYFSVVVAECDGDGRSGGYITEGSGGM